MMLGQINLLKVWNQHRIFLIKHNEIVDAIDLSEDSKKKYDYQKRIWETQEEIVRRVEFSHILLHEINSDLDFGGLLSNYMFPDTPIFQQMIYLLNNMSKLVNKMVKWENYVR